MNVTALREQRAALIHQARELNDKVSNEKRNFSGEEQAQWEKMNADIDALGEQVKRYERIAGLTDGLKEIVLPAGGARNLPGREDRPPDQPAGEQRTTGPTPEDEALAIAGWMLRHSAHDDALTEKHAEAARKCRMNLNASELALKFGAGLMQKRAIGDNPLTVTTTAGGYLIPTGFSYQLEQSLLAYSPLEPYCTQLVTTSGETINWPTVTDTSNAGEMLSINTEVAEAKPTFGNVAFGAFKGSSKICLVPAELMQDSAFNMVSFMAAAMGERLGRLRAAQTTTGAGTTAPTGIVTATNTGVTTASATAITTDEIINLIHSVDPAYRNPAMGTAFLMNDAVVKYVRKLKDGNGKYLWEPSATAGVPDRLFNWPVVISQQMSSSVAASEKTIWFGAMRKFVIRTVGEIRIRRLVERYGEKDQEGWVAFTRFDSNMLDAGTDPGKLLVQHS